jgi:hypothetical protein
MGPMPRPRTHERRDTLSRSVTPCPLRSDMVSLVDGPQRDPALAVSAIPDRGCQEGSARWVAWHGGLWVSRAPGPGIGGWRP